MITIDNATKRLVKELKSKLRGYVECGWAKASTGVQGDYDRINVYVGNDVKVPKDIIPSVYHGFVVETMRVNEHPMSFE